MVTVGNEVLPRIIHEYFCCNHRSAPLWLGKIVLSPTSTSHTLHKSGTCDIRSGVVTHQIKKGQLMRFIVSCLVTLLCLGTTAAFAAAPEPTTDEQKTLYALGLAISQSLGTFSLNESELDLVKSGITDGVFKKLPK